MLAIGCDHGGYEMKEAIIKYFDKANIAYKDFGTFSTESVDYSDIGYEVAKAVSEGRFETGIVICGTGIGISITANKVKGIRAALCTNSFMAKMAREHNNANILALGGRVLGIDHAIDIVKVFLDTPFSGEERHSRRIDKIRIVENGDSSSK
ncbi:MAG: ribose 5-phosphate isomerase B [Clostridiaceae bacterium]|nr:ribose 5-phosphate isomerase B [Clostridiaceae bacterium]